MEFVSVGGPVPRRRLLADFRPAVVADWRSLAWRKAGHGAPAVRISSGKVREAGAEMSMLDQCTEGSRGSRLSR